MRFPAAAIGLAAVALAAACAPSVRSVDVVSAGAAEAVVPAPVDPPELSTTTTTTTAGTATTVDAAEWVLLAGGDVLLDRSERAGLDPFVHLRPTLAAADLAVVNVEMAISDRGTAQEKEYVFRAPPSAARTLARAGVDVGSLGNNHAGDYGHDALLDSVTHLRAAGVAPVGAGRDAAEAYAPATFTIAGVRVAVLGASRVLPVASWAAGAAPGIASAYDGARLAEAVRAAAAVHDVVVVMIHWGVEGAACPEVNQVRLGGALVSAGATVVIGSHPHVLQPVVAVDGGLVAYSLGNFAWHAASGSTAETGVLEVRFRGAALDAHTFHPHVLDGHGAPVPAGDGASERIRAAASRQCPVPA